MSSTCSAASEASASASTRLRSRPRTPWPAQDCTASVHVALYQRRGKDGAAFMKYPYMPLFWGDLLANIMHLSTLEAGAYMFLIAHAWEHDAKIAVCDLRRVTRITNYHWPRVRDRLEQF